MSVIKQEKDNTGKSDKNGDIDFYELKNVQTLSHGSTAHVYTADIITASNMAKVVVKISRKTDESTLNPEIENE